MSISICLPVLNLRVLDAARVPIGNARLMAKQRSRTTEIVTNADGRAQVQAAQSGGPVTVQVWSEHDRRWVSAGDAVLPGASSTAITLIAPSITIETHTDSHTSSERPREANAGSAGQAKPPSENSHKKDTANARQSTGNNSTYTIKRGDSLGSIATAHGTDYRTLAQLNGIKSPYTIQPKQVIKVPVAHSQSNPTAKHAESSVWDRTWETLRAMLESSRSSLDVVLYRGKEDHPQTDLHLGGRAPWMQVAEKEFRASIRRGGGVISDQHIAEYFSATSLHESAARLAKEAYCAAFVNWCLTQAGFKGNNSASAASLATWGKPTRDKKPAFGAVAVVRFPGGGHHVTFVSGHAAGKPSRIATLGGNQGKSHNVSHSAVPASWIVAYRLPSNYVESDKDYELHTVNTDGSTMSAASTH